MLRFVCYDIDDLNAGLEQQDLIGECSCALTDVVTSPGQRLQMRLGLPSSPAAPRGYLTVTSEEVQEMNANLRMRWQADSLDKTDLFGKGSHFLVLERVREDGVNTVVHKSEVVKKTQDPVWAPMELSLQKLCNGDLDRPLQVSVWAWHRNGRHELVGGFRVSVRSLQEQGPGSSFVLVNEEKKARKKKYANSGRLTLTGLETIRTYSFLDYIQGGCEINLAVAIDYTASNGNPRYPASLH